MSFVVRYAKKEAEYMVMRLQEHKLHIMFRDILDIYHIDGFDFGFQRDD